MEKKDVLDKNRLIATFMGSEYINTPFKANDEDKELTDFWHWTKPSTGFPICAVTGIEWSTAYSIENFKYHTSYDWIMPVVYKIKATKGIYFVHDNASIKIYSFGTLIVDAKHEPQLELLFKACVFFILWQNENKL